MSQKKSNTRTPKCKSYTEQAKSIDRRIEELEKGNTLDMVLAGKRIEIEARAIYDAIMVDAPDFITYTLLRVLADAANSKDLPHPDYDEKPEVTIKAIADIFIIARDYKLPTKGSAEELAQALSLVVNHPLTPVDLHNDIQDRLAELDDFEERTSPDYLTRALTAYHAGDKKEVHANG